MKVRKYTCKDCQKSAWTTLKNKEAQMEFTTNQNNLSCDFCAYKFWKPRIASGETKLEEESKEFQELYQKAAKNYE